VDQGYELCVCSQNLVESWAVATRPLAANGFGMEPRDVRPLLETAAAGFSLAPDPAGTLRTWLDLCTQHEVRGRQCFDARLVAVMLASGMTHLVTLNPIDFTRYTMIHLIVPGQPA